MASAVKDLPVVGRNGVVITRRPKTSGKGYRTYEVHQRERVGESTEKIKPAQLASDDYRRDPYPLLEILRENYPCFRDWSGNSYWITQYNDVTSLFADEANFETRSKLWYYELEGFGRDLRAELPVLEARMRAITTAAAQTQGRNDRIHSRAIILQAHGVLLTLRDVGCRTCRRRPRLHHPRRPVPSVGRGRRDGHGSPRDPLHVFEIIVNGRSGSAQSRRQILPAGQRGNKGIRALGAMYFNEARDTDATTTTTTTATARTIISTQGR